MRCARGSRRHTRPRGRPVLTPGAAIRPRWAWPGPPVPARVSSVWTGDMSPRGILAAPAPSGAVTPREVREAHRACGVIIGRTVRRRSCAGHASRLEPSLVGAGIPWASRQAVTRPRPLRGRSPSRPLMSASASVAASSPQESSVGAAIELSAPGRGAARRGSAAPAHRGVCHRPARRCPPRLDQHRRPRLARPLLARPVRPATRIRDHLPLQDGTATIEDGPDLSGCLS